ncbi:MAG TPA: hypothetical protein VGK87_01550 [Anaerolineae bacterium]
MLYLLLIAFMAWPLIGAALAITAGRYRAMRPLAEPLYLLFIVTALICGFMLQPVRLELLFGNWSPVSFTGTPLILATNVNGIAILIAFIAVMAIAPLTSSVTRQDHHRLIFGGLVFVALGLAALAHDMVTLVIGISLVDLLVAVYGLLQNQPAGRVLRDAFFHAISIVLLVIAMALHDASGNSVYIPLVQLSDRVMPFFASALALRFFLVPIRAVADMEHDQDWLNKASAGAGLILLALLPQLAAPEMHAWFFAFALATAITALILGGLTHSRSRLRASIDTAALALAIISAVTWNGGIITAATVTWLLGSTLLSLEPSASSTRFKRLQRMPHLAGLLCLFGLPLTVGFIGRSGIVAVWAGRGLGGAALIVGFALALSLLVLCLLRVYQYAKTPDDVAVAKASEYRYAMVILPVILVLAYGIVPGLVAAPSLGDRLSQQGFIGWFIWVFSAAAGTGLWLIEPYWSVRLAASSERISRFFGLKWWQDIIAGAIDRLSRPWRHVSTFLESDGVLLWAVIVLLLVVLVSRPGKP